MKCPDCGGFLSEVSIGGFDKSFRCFTCGGFWTQSWVVNRMPANAMNQWSPVSVDTAMLSFGTTTCPTDGDKLTRFVGESVPPDVPISRCDKCGWWWFSTDSLFRYKPAQDAKINYFKLWGKTADLAALVLPVLVVTVMIAGLGVGVGLIRDRQQTQISAGAEVRAFSAIYVGSGRAVVSFVASVDLGYVEYRQLGEAEYRTVVAAKEEGGYLVDLEGLTEGATYEVKISDKVFEFEVVKR